MPFTQSEETPGQKLNARLDSSLNDSQKILVGSECWAKLIDYHSIVISVGRVEED